MEKDDKQPPLLATIHASLVVRLVLDEQGRVRRGELVDLQGKVVGRFLRLEELAAVVSWWLDSTLSTCRENIVE